MPFKDYSLTPSGNTELADGTYIGPNMLRNKVRPALQQLAADGKDLANEVANLPLIAKGDPGGNVMATGAFVALSTQVIPAETDVIRTSSYGTNNAGDAFYRRRPDLDADYVAANPLTASLTLSDTGVVGDVFVLDEKIVNPYMFGAFGGAVPNWVSDPAERFIASNEADFVDDWGPCQATLNHLHANPQVGIDLTVGRWAISQKLIAAYPYLGWNVNLNIRGGYFYLLDQMEEALVISGPGINWGGLIYIDGGTRSYSTRRITEQCVRLVNVNGSVLPAFYVEGSKRHGVYPDPTDVGQTFQEGTPYEVTTAFSNNIGCKIGPIIGRTIGYSTTWDLELAFPALMPEYTASENGGEDPNTGAWLAIDPPNQNASAYQRSRCTLPANVVADLRVGDLGRTRIRMDQSEFISYASDATAGTITLTAGDPVAAGFVVGGLFRPSHGGNGGIKFRIKSFGGTSNRTVTVSPKPTITEAAFAVPSFGYIDGGFQHEVIRKVRTSTQIEVFPWRASTVQPAGQFESCHGAVLACFGNNTASMEIEKVYAFGCGTAVLQSGLYGPHIGNLLAEYCEVGVQHGTAYTDTALGLKIDSAHFEACIEDVVQVTAVGNLEITASSSFAGGSRDVATDITVLAPRTFQTDIATASRPLQGGRLTVGGEVFANGGPESYLSSAGSSWTGTTLGVSNRPDQRQRHFPYNSGTIELSWYDNIARVFGEHNWAEVFWFGPTGGAPNSTLAVNLDAPMIWAGWTLVGTSPIAAPAAPRRVRFVFDKANLKVYMVVT